MFRRLCARAATSTSCVRPRWYASTPGALQSKFGSSAGGGAAASAFSAAPRGTERATSSSSSSGAKGAGPMSLTQDSILLPETRAAMRDDTICLTEIIKKMNLLERQLQQQQQQQQQQQEGGASGGASLNPSNNPHAAVAAVSLKYLYNQLNPYVQEALSEKHGGLYNFLKQRKQYFLIVEKRNTSSDPTTPPARAQATGSGGMAYYVQVNPLVKHKFLQRDVQKHTIQKMMGISENFRAPPKRKSSNNSRSSSRGRGRGGGGGGGGGRGRGGRADTYNSSTNNNDSQREGRAFAGAGGKAGKRFGAPRASWSSSYSSKGDVIAKGAMDEKVKHRSFGAGE